MTETEAKTPRSDKGPRITPRDIEAMKWIAEQYTISLDHLCILLDRLRDADQPPGPDTKEDGELTEKRALKIVRRWQELGLAEREHILHGQPQWIWLTPSGLRLVAEQTGELRSHTPQPGRLNHLYWCNHARLFLEGRYPQDAWTSERILRASQGKTEPGVKRPHTPDALVIRSNGNRVAIEVELTTKAYSRLSKILHEMALKAEYYTVWYFVLGRAKTVMEQALAARDMEAYRSKFVIYRLEDLPL